jgi:DNA-binding beta-propeller fold protein YncE
VKKGFQLVSFEAPEKVQFEPLIKPTGVAVRNGKIYVCDAGRTAVFVIDMANKTFETLPGAVGRGSFNKPLNLAFDSDDNLYVADVNRQEILIFDAFGNYLRAIGKEAHMKPTDVGVDGDFVFVSDAKNHDIKVFNRHNDQIVGTIGQNEDMGQDKLSIPIHLDVDSEGNIHVTNTGTGRIVKLDRDGHLLQGFGGLGNVVSLFGRPRGIAVDDQGRIYIVDAAHQNVQIFNESGRLLMYFGGPGEMKLPASVAVTKENLDLFQALAAPNFELERVILVTNHFGDKRLAIYGLGKRKGIDYDAEYAAIKKELEDRIRREQEEAAAKKSQ